MIQIHILVDRSVTLILVRNKNISILKSKYKSVIIY